MHVRVAIPHFFHEGASDKNGGYGSGRKGNRLPRSLALARCLSSVISLNRAPRDWVLNINRQHLELTPPSSLAGAPSVKVELHLFVCGGDWLNDVVQQYLPWLCLHHLELEDPRQLPLAAARQLIDMPAPADLSLYLEDDLVIQDLRFAEKMIWFLEKTDHRFVLMPHRREPSSANAPQYLYVDGPNMNIKPMDPPWVSDEIEHIKVRFWDGQVVSFAEASNPHSGIFCVSAPQLEILKSAPWPPQEFVGPLETAATGAVLDQFPILKPTWNWREFLSIEHGNPSFLPFLNKLPIREGQGWR